MCWNLGEEGFNALGIGNIFCRSVERKRGLIRHGNTQIPADGKIQFQRELNGLCRIFRFDQKRENHRIVVAENGARWIGDALGQGPEDLYFGEVFGSRPIKAGGQTGIARHPPIGFDLAW